MRAELVVTSLITGDAVVTALIAGRVWPGRLPQNTTMPAVSVESVGGNEILPITANAGGTLIKSRIQVTVLAEFYTDVKNVHEAIRKAVLSKSGLFSFSAPNPVVTVRVIGITRDTIGPDRRDDEVTLYMQSVDYQVIHDEA